MTDDLSLDVPSPAGRLRLASGLFGIGAGTSALLGLAAPLCPLGSVLAITACGWMALRYWRRAAITARADRLPQHSPQVVPPASWRPSHLYLGEGCWWDTPHARLLHRIRGRPLAQRSDESISGDPRIFGVLGGTAQPIWIEEAHAKRHILVAGTTGVGKTRFLELLLAQAIHSGAGVVVLDPKGDHDLAARARAVCRAVGREQAFQLLDLAHPHAPGGATYNPLYEVSDPDHLLDRILAVLPRAEGDQFWNTRAQRTGGAVAQTYYWLRRYLSLIGGLSETSREVPRMLLALEYRREHRDHVVTIAEAEAAIAAGAVQLPAERFSPAAWTPRLDVLDTWGVHATERWLAWTVRVTYFHIASADAASVDQVTRDMAPLIYEDYLKRRSHPLENPGHALQAWYAHFVPTQVDRRALLNALEHLRGLIDNEIKPAISADPKHWMSWHSSLDASVSRFRSDVGRLLCASEPTMTWSRLVQERQVAYIALGTLVASTAASNVGKALLEDLKSFIGRRQADGLTGQPLYLIVDEAARIANTALVEIMTMARSSGVRVILAVQTLSGLERELGRNGGQEIVANCNTRVQLQAADVKDAKAFSDLAGSSPIIQLAKSINEQPNVGLSGIQSSRDYTATAGRQMSEKDMPRVPTEAILALPAGEAFVATLGSVALVHFPLLEKPTSESPK